MKNYAQIVNGKVYGIFEYETLPEFDSSISMVELEKDSAVTVGLPYDGANFIYPTLEDLKKEKQKALNLWHEAVTANMKAKYTSAEIESFMDKRKEALAWRDNNTSPTPYVSAMVGGVEEARVSLLNAILAKVDAVAQAEMYVLMTRDVIEACTTKEEIDAVEFPNV